MPLTHPLTYLLVDFENTQPKADEVALVRPGAHQLWIFRGPGQKKYDAEFVESLLTLGEAARVVRCEKSGANALDMHIAFELGRLASAATAAAPAPLPEFIVVSKDSDYEPLLQYLVKQGFAARREKTLKSAVAHLAASARAERSTKPARSSGTEAAVVPSPPAAKRARKSTPAAAAAPGGARTAPAQAASSSVAKRPAKAARTAAIKVGSNGAGRADANGHGGKAAKKQSEPARGGRAEASAMGRKAEANAVGLVATPAPVASDDPMARVVAALRAHPKSRPVKLASLLAWLQARQLSAQQAELLVQRLQQAGELQLDGKKVLYPQAH